MGGIFSNEEPKQDLTKYVTSDQLTAKNYINKDINDLTNYYTKNYINTNYINNDNLKLKNYITNDQLTSKNYITNDQLTSKNYITNDQLTSKNYITKDVNNLTNYQSKGNYLTYSNNDKNTFDLESEYMLFRDNNKKNILNVNKNSIDIYNKINLNNEFNIGDDKNFFNIKKNNNCLVTTYYKNQGTSTASSVVLNNLCDSEYNRNSFSPNNENEVIFYNELIQVLKNMDFSVYTKTLNSNSYVNETEKYKFNHWTININSQNLPSEEMKMVKQVSSERISINFKIKDVKNFLIEYSNKNPDIKNGYLIFVFTGYGKENADFKAITSNTINDVTKEPFIKSKTTLQNGEFRFFENESENIINNPDIIKRVSSIHSSIANKIYTIGIKYTKFNELEDYITFTTNSSCDISFYLVTFILQ